jgi:hypothetical protein
MREWIVVPESFYDEPETLAAWARRAHHLAPPKRATKKAGKSAKPPAKKAKRR